MITWLEIHKQDGTHPLIVDAAPVPSTVGQHGYGDGEGFRAWLNLTDGRLVYGVGEPIDQAGQTGPRVLGFVHCYLRFRDGFGVQLGRSTQRPYHDQVRALSSDLEGGLFGLLDQLDVAADELREWFGIEP